ncbi:MAG: hypothetical protein WC523_06765 [Patescibacteria group bacterium]|jgi:hypothetical protein
MPPKKISVLGLLSQNEEKIATLYAIFAKVFPLQEKFWQNLVNEEKEHAAALRKLDLVYGQNPRALKDSPYSQAIIDYVSKFIDESIAEARQAGISLAQALIIALRVEHSLIEKKNFEVFSPQVLEIEVVLERLNRETRGHAARLNKLANREKIELGDNLNNG